MQGDVYTSLPPRIIDVNQEEIYAEVGNAIYILNEDRCEEGYTASSGLSVLSNVQDDILYIAVQTSFQGNMLECFRMSDRTLLWNYVINHPSPHAASHIAHSLVYFCEGSHVVALHKSTGKPHWQCRIGTPLSALSKIDDKTLYVVAQDEEISLYAINSDDGSVRWRTSLPSLFYMPLIAPIIGQQTIIVGSQTGCLTFRKSDGSFIWQYSDAPIINGIGTDNGQICLCHPIYEPKIVEVYSPTAKFSEKKELITLFREIDGTLLWKHVLTDEKGIKFSFSTSPLMRGEMLYIVAKETEGNALLVFSTANGSLLWSYRSGETVLSMPFIKDNTLYIGSNDGYAHALQADSGTFLWKTFVTTSFGIEIHVSPMILERTSKAT